MYFIFSILAVARSTKLSWTTWLHSATTKPSIPYLTALIEFKGVLASCGPPARDRLKFKPHDPIFYGDFAKSRDRSKSSAVNREIDLQDDRLFGGSIDIWSTFQKIDTRSLFWKVDTRSIFRKIDIKSIFWNLHQNFFNHVPSFGKSCEWHFSMVGHHSSIFSKAMRLSRFSYKSTTRRVLILLYRKKPVV